MRISDWSSDVCASDLVAEALPTLRTLPCRYAARHCPIHACSTIRSNCISSARAIDSASCFREKRTDRKSVVEGKRVSGRVELVGRRILTPNKNSSTNIRRYNQTIQQTADVTQI